MLKHRQIRPAWDLVSYTKNGNFVQRPPCVFYSNLIQCLIRNCAWLSCSQGVKCQPLQADERDHGKVCVYGAARIYRRTCAMASHLVWVWGESQFADFVTTKINYPLRIQRLVTEVCTIATIPNNRKPKIATRLQEHKFWPLTFFTSRHFCPLISRVQKTFANTTQRWWGYIWNFPQRSICGACLNCGQK